MRTASIDNPEGFVPIAYPPGVFQYATDVYIPKNGMAADVHPYVSPLHHPFNTKVPIFVFCSTSEVFYDEVKDFAEDMANTEGNEILFREMNDAPHDIFVAHNWIDSFTSQVNLAVSEASKFLCGHTL